jgi:hypothetical protein
MLKNERSDVNTHEIKGLLQRIGSRTCLGDLLLQKLNRLLLAPLSWFAATIFLIEEAIWDWTAAFMARLGALKLVHAIEKRVAALPPRRALIAFLLPSATIIPAKLIGVHAIATGHWLLGSVVFMLAKLLGMALFARIFNLTRPALMQLAWFARLYATVMRYRNRIHIYLDNWPAYLRIKQHIKILASSIKSVFKRKTR